MKASYEVPQDLSHPYLRNIPENSEDSYGGSHLKLPPGAISSDENSSAAGSRGSSGSRQRKSPTKRKKSLWDEHHESQRSTDSRQDEKPESPVMIMTDVKPISKLEQMRTVVKQSEAEAGMRKAKTQK